MSVRKIVHIDEELCDGCGDCVPSCAEGAIKIIDGKAKLLADNLCDGLGACLGECPQGAITVEERAADAFDEEAVAEHLGQAHDAGEPKPAPPTIPNMPPAGSCPGSQIRQFAPQPAPVTAPGPDVPADSALRQWPVQLHLIPPTAPFLKGANLLLAADCAAFASGEFHPTHLAGKALAIACPKLDHSQDAYRQKLTAMIDAGGIDTLTVLIMEVPCCSGLAGVAREAAEQAKRNVPVKRMVMSLQGDVFDEEWL
ncbi:MAG: 4Fe-4S ferredoxin [bacterium]|nr:4Fe-4S ferredoxin [bacterium]